jgi:methionyl-tRNA synthetase
VSTYYVTTAIPYVNAAPHLGFALELVQADVLARHHRLRGDHTRLLTGTDENSLTAVLAAAREGLPVRALVDRNAALFQALPAALDAAPDDFIRTAADPRHREGAARLWAACARRGDLYRRHYRGLYCVRCERFYAPGELRDGRCPEHDVAPEAVEEENWFFRLSRYAEPLARLLDSGGLRVVPAWRHAEVRAFVAAGLEDFSVSRSRARAHGWGIAVPGDPEQVMYVWFDALANYVSALGYGRDAPAYRRYWRDNPCRVHVIGKDIVRFHAVYWPAMLLSAGEPPPATLLVHGFLTRDGRRMSKSLGTGVDPVDLARRWGADAVRYWLLRHVPPAGDADYTDAAFAAAYTGELANGLGNLLSRTVVLVARHRGGATPTPGLDGGSELRTAAAGLGAVVQRALGEAHDPREALDAVFRVVGLANREVDATRPWELARAEQAGDGAAGRRLDAVLGDLAEALRLVGEALRPLLPGAAGRIAVRLGAAPAADWPRALSWGAGAAGARVAPAEPLFPRVVDSPGVTEGA